MATLHLDNAYVLLKICIIQNSSRPLSSKFYDLKSFMFDHVETIDVFFHQPFSFFLFYFFVFTMTIVSIQIVLLYCKENMCLL